MELLPALIGLPFAQAIRLAILNLCLDLGSIAFLLFAFVLMLFLCSLHIIAFPDTGPFQAPTPNPVHSVDGAHVRGMYVLMAMETICGAIGARVGR
jgi:hypothetical protein